MIEALGKKRVMFLGVLILLNALLGALVFLYLMPEVETSDRTLRSVNGQFSSLRSDFDSLMLDFQELEKQQYEYEELKQRGFFGLQGRRPAAALLESIDKESKIISTKVAIGSGGITENEEAAKADYVLLESPVSLSIESIDDVDVFSYINLLNHAFPGHISIDEMVMKRTLDVSGGVLRAIAAGQKPRVVNTRLEMTWRTMIPKTSIIENQEGLQ